MFFQQLKPQQTRKNIQARCLIFLWLCFLMTASSWAASYQDIYIAPEMMYSKDLGQTIQVPKQMNLNQVSLNQIRTLPGFDDNLALKVIRNRPFRGMQDFYEKMPVQDRKHLQWVIQQVETSIRF